MRKYYLAALLFVVAVFMLSACSASLKEEQNAAKTAAEEAFNSSPKETNNKNEDIEFYLPFGVEIKKETPNNIILKNGSKTYILFYNQHEGEDSKVVYNATIDQNIEYDVNERFTKDGHEGFLLINNKDENISELIVGIGGVKITTQAKTKNLSTEAAVMMEIANSVKVK